MQYKLHIYQEDMETYSEYVFNNSDIPMFFASEIDVKDVYSQARYHLEFRADNLFPDTEESILAAYHFLATLQLTKKIVKIDVFYKKDENDDFIKLGTDNLQLENICFRKELVNGNLRTVLLFEYY